SGLIISTGLAVTPSPAFTAARTAGSVEATYASRHGISALLSVASTISRNGLGSSSNTRGIGSPFCNMYSAAQYQCVGEVRRFNALNAEGRWVVTIKSTSWDSRISAI